MLLVGYFEGIQSQRGIAWRCADSLSIRQFLGLKLTDHSPDHSSLTVIRERLPETVHVSVFEWVLRLANEKKLLGGKTVAVDSTRVANFKGSEASKWNDPSRTCWRQAGTPLSVTWNRKDPKEVLRNDRGIQPWGGHAHAVRNWHFEELAGDDGGHFGLFHVLQNALVCHPNRS
jgi:hypothetical protein